MNRKALFLLSLLMMFINSAAFGIEYEVPEGNDKIREVVTSHSEAIADYCHFDRSKPVEVILDSQTLSSQLNRPWSPISGTFQCLLINDYYEINTTISIYRIVKLCGLHDWLADLNSRLTRSIRQALNKTEGIAEFGSKSLKDCNIASIINNVAGEESERCPSYRRGKKTTLLFIYSGHFLLVTGVRTIDLHHLNLRTKGSRQTRKPMLKLSQFTRAHMSDVEMEDLSGVADSLLKMDDYSRLYAENTTFNFKQRPDGSSKALDLLLVNEIRLDSDTINCYGTTGTAIYWLGIFGYNPSLQFFLRNLQINVPRDDANMTGMYLLGKTGDFHFFPVELSNITLTGGLSTGFEFAGDFHLATTDDCGIANTNNHWQSTRQDAQRCVGSPARGVLLFADHVACVPEK